MYIWNDVYEICAKTFLEETFHVRSKFSCVRSFHGLCSRAHAHSLEGTLVTTKLLVCYLHVWGCMRFLAVTGDF